MESELIIDPKAPSFFKKIVAAFLFTLSFALGFHFFPQMTSVPIDNAIGIFLFGLVVCLIPFIIAISVVGQHAIHLNFTEKQIRYELLIGPFSYKESWQKFDPLNCISIIKDDDLYLVNLWYQSNERINLFGHTDLKLCIEKGKLFARNLEIDLLDATERKQKWIDID